MSKRVDIDSVNIPRTGVFEIERSAHQALAKDFAEVYANCFADPPYCETYDPEWIIAHVYNPHIAHGRVAVALKEGTMIGFSCAMMLHADTSACYYKYLSAQENLPFEIDKSMFVTELAVLSEYRRKGLGTALAKHMMCSKGSLHQYDHCVTRTAHQGSNSIGIFTKLGAQVLPGLHHVNNDPNEVPSASEARVYLWRSVYQS